MSKTFVPIMKKKCSIFTVFCQILSLYTHIYIYICMCVCVCVCVYVCHHHHLHQFNLTARISPSPLSLSHSLSLSPSVPIILSFVTGLPNRSDFHIIDNLSIVVHAFTNCMLTSLSVDEILLPRLMSFSTNFALLSLRVKMTPSV